MEEAVQRTSTKHERELQGREIRRRNALPWQNLALDRSNWDLNVA